MKVAPPTAGATLNAGAHAVYSRGHVPPNWSNVSANTLSSSPHPDLFYPAKERKKKEEAVGPRKREITPNVRNIADASLTDATLTLSETDCFSVAFFF